MADLDLETVERVARWCAEAGRQCAPPEIRAALGSLGWDQLLTLRALLADPPPARPLGPFALADLVRGLPPDAAAEREREQRYPRPETLVATPAPAGPASPTDQPAEATPPARTRGRKRPRAVLVRKASSLQPAPPPAPPPRPLLDELHLPAGRNELERLFRRHGGRRPHLLAALATSHRRADGAPIDDGDLDRLLEHHGLTRGFVRRERDELRHALRAAGGVLFRAAAVLGFSPEGLKAALARLELEGEVATLREARRRELRGRATLAERAQLILSDPERLTDLELLPEFERDLASRLPEHLRALAQQREPVALGLARTLSMPVKAVHDLMARIGVELPSGGFGSLPGARPIATGSYRPVAPAPGPRPGAPRSSVTRTGPRPIAPRPATARSGPERSGPARPGPRRPPPARPGGNRGERPTRTGPAPSGPPGTRTPRFGAPRTGPSSASRTGPRGAPRGSPRSAPRTGPRGATRPPGGPRTGGGRPTSPRPGGRRGPNR